MFCMDEADGVPGPACGPTVGPPVVARLGETVTKEELGGTEIHAKNGAVDETFVQFYPTLIPVAKAKGTFKGEAEK